VGVVLPSGQLKDTGAVEFLPYLVKGFREIFFDPRLWLLGQLECRRDGMFFEEGRGLRANTPYLLYREFGEIAVQLSNGDRRQTRWLLPLCSHLRLHLIRSQTHREGKTQLGIDLLLDACGDLEVGHSQGTAQPRQVRKALIDRIL